MAVTVEGTPTKASIQNAASVTWSHTAGGDGLFVGAGNRANQATSATFNADAMTEKWDFYDEQVNRCAGYILVAPDAGAHNVVVTWAASLNYGWGGAVGLTGLDQTTPTRTAYTATDNDTVTVVDSVADDLVIDFMAAYENASTADPSQTVRVSDNNILDGNFNAGISTEVAVGANTVMSWSGATYVGIGAMALIAAAAGGGGADTAKKRMSATHLLVPSFPMAILPD